MKRVGIITYHRACNYGAALQCYALQTILSRLGYEAFVIDYRQPHIELAYNPIRWDVMRRGLTRPRLLGGYLLKVLPERWRRARAYRKFRKSNLLCSPKVTCAEQMPQNVDIYLIGSDQMWSLHCTDFRLDEIYFGCFPYPETSYICGYAISSTLRSLHTIGSKALATYVRNFRQLSFREETICHEVEKMTCMRGHVVLDPTLLLEGDDWKKLAGCPLIRQRYLLTYFLHDGADDAHFKADIRVYARKRGLAVLDMFEVALSPIDFLSAVCHAECIITSSFHATAFSIMFKKKFYSLRTGNGKDIRYFDLMQRLGIANHVIDVNELGKMEDEEEIDYERVHHCLLELRKDSVEYLKNL